MKLKIVSYITAAMVIVLAGCTKLDNFDAPESTLSGFIVQKGTTTPLLLRANTDNTLQVFQKGFPLFTPIQIYIKQDGSYSVKLYDGNYLMHRVAGRGPWEDQLLDSIPVAVKGNTELNIPVDPYFTITSVTYSAVTGNGTTATPWSVTATATIKQGNITKTLENVKLFLGKTTLVDQNNKMSGEGTKTAAQVGAFTAGSATTAVTATLLSANYGRTYAYARVGVKTTGVGELVFSAPVEITLP